MSFHTEGRAHSPCVIICANQAWNLVNFRANIISALIEKGATVIAVAPPDPIAEGKLRTMGCLFEPLDIDAAGISPLRDAVLSVKILRILQRHKPIVYLSWTIKPNIYGSIAARIAGVPALPNISGLGTAFIRENLLTKIVRSLYRFAFAKIPFAIFQNDDDRSLFVRQGMITADRTLQVPGSGVDTEYFTPVTLDRPVSRHFMMVSRLLRDKGIIEFIEAARSIKCEYPQACFTILGAVDVANRTAISRAELNSWIAEGLVSHIEPVEDVRPIMATADFIVLPSYREGLSRVLLEAGALRKPIVTTEVTGCRDVVTDGVNGFLCAARDPVSLANALKRAVRLTDSEWHRMADAGRARIISDFSSDRVVNIYLAALNKIGFG
jgi:glycosyltransferase involved in cell wall biosynthesis